MYFRFIAISIITLVFNSSSSFAQQANNAQNDPNTGSTAFKTLALSGQLIAYGRSNHDALALLLAADMRKGLSLKNVSRKAAEDESDNSNTSNDEIEAILAEATKIAGDKESYLELIEDVRASASKGKSDGPAYNIKTIKAMGKNSYRNIEFSGGQYAEIYVEGSGRANLDLFVYDAKGRLVCSDTDPSDINYCGWTPLANGAYRVTIVNKSNRPNRYSLMTN